MGDAPDIFATCAEHNLASIANTPLAMGLHSGKFNRDSRLPASEVRGSGHAWVSYFVNGRPQPEFLAKLDAIREMLASEGRTLVQGALAWLWGRSNRTVPIPGFKTAAQATQNASAMRYEPLTPAQTAEIGSLLVAVVA